MIESSRDVGVRGRRPVACDQALHIRRGSKTIEESSAPLADSASTRKSAVEYDAGVLERQRPLFAVIKTASEAVRPRSTRSSLGDVRPQSGADHRCERIVVETAPFAVSARSAGNPAPSDRAVTSNQRIGTNGNLRGVAVVDAASVCRARGKDFPWNLNAGPADHPIRYDQSRSNRHRRTSRILDRSARGESSQARSSPVESHHDRIER